MRLTKLTPPEPHLRAVLKTTTNKIDVAKRRVAPMTKRDGAAFVRLHRQSEHAVDRRPSRFIFDFFLKIRTRSERRRVLFANGFESRSGQSYHLVGAGVMEDRAPTSGHATSEPWRSRWTRIWDRSLDENLEPGINLLPTGVRGKRHPGLAGRPALL